MENKTLFEITTEDAQFSAKHRIGRELSEDEVNDIQRYLRIAFEDWGDIMKNAVLAVTRAKELTQ